MAVRSRKSSLNCYILNGVEQKGAGLGAGAYGKVFEVQYAGKCCAAKEIHPIFFEVSQPEDVEKLKIKFRQECRIWSKLNHENIVTLIGIYFRDGDSTSMPIMVMEKMDCTLCSMIEKSQQNKVDLQIKLSILHDVAVGLWYLHSQDPSIIHRDLTPNNILLCKGIKGGVHCIKAKISDLGVSKVMDQDTSRMTKIPGTPDFMPPETFYDNPVYDTAVDIFSYACVILYSISEQWPRPTEKVTRENTVVLEVERRQVYLNKLTKLKELKSLVISCLHDKPEHRPAIPEVCSAIKKLEETLKVCLRRICIVPYTLYSKTFKIRTFGPHQQCALCRKNF